MRISFNYYPEGKRKALTMSYDDGHTYDRRLVSIFNKYGIKGTFHLNSGKLDEEPCLSKAEVNVLFKGHEIAAHSLNHPYLTLVPKEMLQREILEDRRRLEAIAGYPIRGMSYPFGDYNEELKKALPSFGIEYSRTVQSRGDFRLPDNFLAWHPTCHHEQNLLELCRQFMDTPSWKQMPLLYVWGHSFEFERNNNWELIEEFCKEVSHDESVWYATNIEIVDYLKALKNLKFSVDRRIISNPSAIHVWIDVEGQPVKIESGQRISL